MNVTINSSIIPIILTIIGLCVMFRPYHTSGDFDFGIIFRAFWLIPILIVWTLYFGVMYYLK